MKKSSPTSVEDVLKTFLEKTSGAPIKSRTADLLALGIVSSFTMFQLLEFIERRFKTRVDIAALRPERFNTLARIAEHVRLWTSR